MTSGIGAESVLTDTWIEATLLANVTVTGHVGTRVRLDQGNDDDLYPFIVYQLQSGLDLRVVGPDRVWVDTLYVVKAVAQCDDFGTLAPVAAALDDALTSTTGGTVADPSGQVFCCVREEPFRLTEVSNGQQFRHLGGIYRLYAQGS